jgi:hypothetical protein
MAPQRLWSRQRQFPLSKKSLKIKIPPAAFCRHAAQTGWFLRN